MTHAGIGRRGREQVAGNDIRLPQCGMLAHLTRNYFSEVFCNLACCVLEVHAERKGLTMAGSSSSSYVGVLPKSALASVVTPILRDYLQHVVHYISVGRVMYLRLQTEPLLSQRDLARSWWCERGLHPVFVRVVEWRRIVSFQLRSCRMSCRLVLSHPVMPDSFLAVFS